MAADMKRVLMLAFHFPPMRGSSGAQRTLNFCRHLPEHGWEPRVLTVTAGAHPETSADQLGDIPAGVVVRRSFALDAARHAAIGGRYPGFLARPDRWASWRLTAVRAALREVGQWRPDAIWSTFPIATTHAIAAQVQRRCGLPWVADFRDLMTEDDFPADPKIRAQWRAIEERVVHQAARSVFTTRGAVSTYAHRYPDIASDRWACIANGYAEEDFVAAGAQLRDARSDGKLRLLHSGLLYPSERDPTAFFEALGVMRREGEVSAAGLVVTLRATGHDAYLAGMIRAAGIEDLVEIRPPIGYRAALAEMMSVDGLLVLQAANCNHQIPAKLYEYLRAGRPILALTDPAGETARTLLAGGIDSIVPLDQRQAIRTRLQRFLSGLRAGDAPVASQAFVASFSRRAQTAALATLLDGASARPSPGDGQPRRRNK